MEEMLSATLPSPSCASMLACLAAQEARLALTTTAIGPARRDASQLSLRGSATGGGQQQAGGQQQVARRWELSADVLRLSG